MMTRQIRNLAVLLLILGTASGHAQEFPAVQPFELATADGTRLELPADQNGIGIYLFWASWCPYCRALMPHLQSLEDEFDSKITIYALNFRDQQDPEAYIAEHGFDFTLMPDADPVAERWGVQGTPGLFIVDREGRVRFNLYDVLATNPPGFEELDHTQRAQRRAPFWAARIREALDDVMSESESSS